MPELGKLVKLSVDEIRKIWPHEEKNLSPWIEENIDDLNNALKLQIEIISREESIHNFRLDLAGMDNSSQMPVVIENQFGSTDHDHLGKLITYSAVKEAGIMIWIANDFQIAHKTAVDWLNKITPSEMIFYGIELEVFKIDESNPAHNFRIVAGPPPSKRTPPPPGELSPRNQKYLDFFEKLRQKILNLQPGITRAKALPQSWWGLGIGKSGYFISVAFTIDSKFRVELYIDNGSKSNNDAAFEKLRENSSLLSQKIGHDLIWEPLPESRACRVYTAIDATIDDDDQTLNHAIEWSAPLMLKFREVFGPMVKNIQTDQ